MTTCNRCNECSTSTLLTFDAGREASGAPKHKPSMSTMAGLALEIGRAEEEDLDDFKLASDLQASRNLRSQVASRAQTRLEVVVSFDQRRLQV